MWWSFSFAITEEGHAYSWGLGTSLQLGVGDEDDMYVPTVVQSKNVNLDEDEVLSISAGGQHTAVLIRKREPHSTENESWRKNIWCKRFWLAETEISFVSCYSRHKNK